MSTLLLWSNVAVEVRPECYVNDDCGFNEVCNQGSCVDACRVTQCGVNARCEARRHAGTCTCLPGFSGNPDIACNPGRRQFPQKLNVWRNACASVFSLFATHTSWDLIWVWEKWGLPNLQCLWKQKMHWPLHWAWPLCKVCNLSSH